MIAESWPWDTEEGWRTGPGCSRSSVLSPAPFLHGSLGWHFPHGVPPHGLNQVDHAVSFTIPSAMISCLL